MNPNGENLGKCGLEGTKGIPAEFPAEGSKIDNWIEVIQSAQRNSDSSNSKTKIISLIHTLIPSIKAKSAFNARLESQLLLPKTTRTS